MAIQLKNDGDYNTDKLTSTMFEEVSGEEFAKFKGGLGDGTVDIDKINDLPAYTGPSVIPQGGAGVGSGAQKRSIIGKIVGAVVIIAVIAFLCYGIFYLIGSGGEDISSKLTMTEDELAEDMELTFEDNPSKVKSVQHYSNGTISVRSAGELNVIYIDGKQYGINTSSRRYKFFNVAINQPEKTAIRDMTFQYDDCYSIINDMMGGNSDSYYYYNKSTKEALVLVVSKRTNRIVDMTYYTDYKKISEKLSGLD